MAARAQIGIGLACESVYINRRRELSQLLMNHHRIDHVSWSRRSFLWTSVCAACSTLLSSSAWAESQRILILGDSMIAGGFGLYLEQNLKEKFGFAVRRQGKTSSGLARPDFFNWNKQAEIEMDKFKPNATVVMFGGNDGQGLHRAHQKDSAPKWIRWNEPGWTVEYRRRVNLFADIVAPPGVFLAWIGMPIVRPERLNARVQHINTIFRAEMAIRPHAKFLDIWPVLANDKLHYVDRLKIGKKERVRVRAGDGVHLTVRGAKYLAQNVAPRIEKALANVTTMLNDANVPTLYPKPVSPSQ